MAFNWKQKKQTLSGRRNRAEIDSVHESPIMTQKFRRNTTLSQQPQERRSDNESSRTKAHALRIRRRQIIIIFIGILVIISTLLWLVSQFSARVVVTQSSAPSGTSSDSAVYEAAVNSYLDVHPIERLRFLTNAQALNEHVRGVAPEVATLSLSSHYVMATSAITIEFRRPIAKWSINGKQLFVDEKGVVFEKNYFQQPAVSIVDESGSTPEQGSTVASSRFLSFVGQVVAKSREVGYTVRDAIIPEGTTRQLHVTIEQGSMTIIFSIDRGAGEQAADMATALKYLSSHAISPRYVDVRVAGKAVYR